MSSDDPRYRPCSVRKVAIRGLSHTHEHVVRQELAPLQRASTLGEIRDACLEAAAGLQALGIFEAAELFMDTPPATASRARDGTPLADVVCTVAEKKRLTSASTMVSTQSGEGSAEAKVSVRNLLGRAEQFDLQMEVGQNKSEAFRLTAARPRWLGPDTALSAELSKQVVSQIKHSSFMEKLLGGSVGAQFGAAGAPGGCHDIGCKLELRDVCRLPAQTASWAILRQRGASVKSSLTHTFTRTTLDNPLMPSSGGMVRLATELAGLLPLPIGDARFLKHSLTAAGFAPILPDGRLTIGLSVQAGALLPLGTQAAEAESNICDRFFAGGPGSFWGFRTRGLGPREPRHCLAASRAAGARAPPCDSLGGDLLGVATVSVAAALPGNFGRLGARAHAFASAGGLQSLPAIKAAGGRLSPSIRACAGVGVAMPSQVGRIEANLTHVLRSLDGDAVVRNGMQVGITVGFS